MKRNQFSVEHVVAVLNQAELRTPMAGLIHETGITNHRSIDRNCRIKRLNTKCGNSNNGKRKTPGRNGGGETAFEYSHAPRFVGEQF